MSTKIHATCDALGNPTSFHLTPGQAHDLDGADALLPSLQAEALLAYKAYDADARVQDKLEDRDVALATVSKCSLIVSWNFKHIVHFEKIPLYNAVNTLKRFTYRYTSYNPLARIKVFRNKDLRASLTRMTITITITIEP